MEITASDFDLTMPLGRARRASLGEFALQLEVRGREVWIVERTIPYYDIRAVYRYEARDWPVLLPAALTWCGALLLAVLAGSLLGWSQALQVVAMLSATLAIGGVAAYRVACVRRPMIRVTAVDRRLDLPATRPGFFEALAARLDH